LKADGVFFANDSPRRTRPHSHSIVDRQENPFDINIIFEAEQQNAMKNAMPSSPGAG
jgi:hypothetical protein